MNKKTEAAPAEARFTREQLLSSKAFRDDRDLLDALIKDGAYTLAEARELIEKYKKGKVR